MGAVNTPCREFHASKNEHGYGRRQVKRFRSRYLHKQILEMVGADQYGTSFDPDAVVMHECDNPSCFRFDHLRLGTQAENIADAVAKGRTSNAYRHATHCINGHEFTPENTYHPPKRPQHRHCRACSAERNARRVRGGQ